jgi:hypothetical protein
MASGDEERDDRQPFGAIVTIEANYDVERMMWRHPSVVQYCVAAAVKQ